MPKQGPELNPASPFQQSNRGGFGSREPLPQPAEDVSPPVEDTSNSGRDFGVGKTSDDTGRELGM